MIKFIENSETKLNFIVYPISKLIGILFFLIVLLPFIYWGLFITPVYSSLECERNEQGQVNCLLVERKAIALKSDKTKIKNVRDIDGILRGLLNNKQMVIRANPGESSLRFVGYQKKYYYPSTANTLIYLNLKSGFRLFEQRTQVNNFIRGKTTSKYIKVDLKLDWVTLIFILFLMFSFLSIILNSPFKTTYNFDREKKTLTISLTRVLLDDITKIYSFERIKQVRFDCNNSEEIATGTIVIQFTPDYDYSLAEFSDLEQGKEAFETIKDFIDRYR